jgi:GNAT superfamily N-acetyltransferase
MAVAIRAIRADDFDDWHRLWTGYLAYYETTLSDETKKIAFARLLAGDTRVHGLLAELDERPVGLVHYLFHDHMWRPEGICYLQDLYTDAPARGHGVGRALIKAVYLAADKAGAPQVYWLTQDFNQAARKLYDRVGQLTPFIRYDRP